MTTEAQRLHQSQDVQSTQRVSKALHQKLAQTKNLLNEIRDALKKWRDMEADIRAALDKIASLPTVGW